MTVLITLIIILSFPIVALISCVIIFEKYYKFRWRRSRGIYFEYESAFEWYRKYRLKTVFFLKLGMLVGGLILGWYVGNILLMIFCSLMSILGYSEVVAIDEGDRAYKIRQLNYNNALQ